MGDRELMQQALDALEYLATQTRPVYSAEKAIEAIRDRLAQPEQPQIVWIDNKQTGNFLNITPPQREWQTLTDEEIREFEIWLDNDEEEHGWNPPENIVKYLEAKLREKNHG